MRSAVAERRAREEPWAQVIRTSVRQEGDLASAWAVTSPPSSGGQGERVTFFVLRREVAGWTVEFHGSPSR